MEPRRRRVLLGLAHLAAARLGLDEAARRAAQAAWCGKESLRDFTDAELVAWLWELKRRGAEIGIPAPPAPGGEGLDRPSDRQRLEIERLAAALGLDERGFSRFLRRSAGVDAPRFLDRRGASAAISGLRRWLAQRQRGAA